jgi:hypothetical protein
MVTGADVPGIGEAVTAVFARTGYPNYSPYLALAHLRDGDAAAAWATLGPLAADEFSALPIDVAWAGALACASLVAAELRRTEAAECLLRLLSPYPDQVIVAAAMPFGSVSHFIGLLAASLGDDDRAAAAFAAAADLSARMAAPGFLAGTQTEWARLLLRRRHPGDADYARQLLTQALDSARQLSLPKIERDAVALLQ